MASKISRKFGRVEGWKTGRMEGERQWNATALAIHSLAGQ